MEIVLVTGGARSGKSAFALKEAERRGEQRAYIATAEALDDEMAERIAAHRRDRREGWETFEEPRDLAGLLRKTASSHDVAVVDCLTLWLSNIHMPPPGPDDPEGAIAGLTGALEELKAASPRLSRLYLVSNEIGMGIVPLDGSVRKFRDRAGRLNQRTAAAADEVYLMVSGLPLRIK